MSTNYPTTIDSLPRPSATTNMDATGFEGDVIVNNLSDAIESVQTKVGVNGSLDQNSLDFKLSGVAGGDKAVSLTGAETISNKTIISATITSPVITNPSIVGFETDSISEATPNTGVTIDSVLSKDGNVILGNTKSLQVKDSSNTDRNAITVSASNIMTIGSPNYTSFVQAVRSGCLVRRNSTQSIPDNTATKIQYASETFDLANEYDSTTNYRFTAVAEGYYMVFATIRYQDIGTTPTQNYIAIYKNGSEYLHSGAPVTGNFNNLSVQAPVQLNAGGYIEIFAFQQTGGSKTIDSNGNTSYMWIMKIF